MSMGFSFSSHTRPDLATQSMANHAGSAARQAGSDVRLLKAEVERLYMITEALWTVLRRQHGLEDEDLVELVRAIDLEDGHLDGRKAPQGAPPPCPSCDRILQRRRPFCIYCGAEVPVDPFER